DKLVTGVQTCALPISFIMRNLEKAGYETNPLDDDTLNAYQVFRVPMTTITLRATEGQPISKKDAERSKNFFALGLVSWMYGRPRSEERRVGKERRSRW